MERAKRIDFDCFIRTDPDTGLDTLHFVSPTDARDCRRDPRLPVRVGQEPDLVRPVADRSSRQVASVTVRGWDSAVQGADLVHRHVGDLPGSPAGGDSGPGVAATDAERTRRRSWWTRP